MIRLTDYGFVREADSDFGDDGTKFKCYRFGNFVRVTYGRSPKCDMVFITADVHDNRFYNWDFEHKSWRSRLVEHDLGWKYNGIFEYEFNIKEFIEKCKKLDMLLTSSTDEALCKMIDDARHAEMVEEQTKAVEEFLRRSTEFGRELMLKKLQEK